MTVHIVESEKMSFVFPTEKPEKGVHTISFPKSETITLGKKSIEHDRDKKD